MNPFDNLDQLAIKTYAADLTAICDHIESAPGKEGEIRREEQAVILNIAGHDPLIFFPKNCTANYELVGIPEIIRIADIAGMDYCSLLALILKRCWEIHLTTKFPDEDPEIIIQDVGRIRECRSSFTPDKQGIFTALLKAMQIPDGESKAGFFNTIHEMMLNNIFLVDHAKVDSMYGSHKIAELALKSGQTETMNDEFECEKQKFLTTISGISEKLIWHRTISEELQKYIDRYMGLFGQLEIARLEETIRGKN